MRRIPRHLSLSLALGALAACSDVAPHPVTPDAQSARPSSEMSMTTDVWNMADVEADFGGLYSLDTTQVGMDASLYVAPADPYTGDRGFCRDHFNAIDLWWDGGYGLMRFHLNPPLLFVAYRTGTYTSPRNLVFRRAIYETIAPSEATDPAGNVWRFEGRYNALCRGGQLELGPVVFGGQIVVAQDPITRPVLVRRGTGDDGCGDGGSGGDWHYMELYDPYSPAPENAGETVTTSCGGGGSDGGGSDPTGYSCTWDYITIEISYDGGQTWHDFWSGWAQVCESAE